MKETLQMQKMMRDIERTVRERPQDSMDTLSSLLLAGESLTLAQIYIFCFRFVTPISTLLIVVLMLSTIWVENFIENWLVEIAKLYGVNGMHYRMKLTYWPACLAISLLMLLSMGFSFIYFVIGVGVPLLAFVGVLIYVANYCCKRFNPGA